MDSPKAKRSFARKLCDLEIEFLCLPDYRKDAERNLSEVTRFLSHPELLVKQKKVVEKVLGSVTELPPPPVVVPVSMPDPYLRGWCGIDRIFVNLAPFQLLPRPQFFRADLCTILAHESMHYYLRQIDGDWNFSTPTKLGNPTGPSFLTLSTVTSNIPMEDREGGRLIELELFDGYQPDWMDADTCRTLDPDLVSDWVRCAIEHCTLPKLDFSEANRVSKTRGFDEKYFRSVEF